jgi:RNA-directed DNA polymerase
MGMERRDCIKLYIFFTQLNNRKKYMEYTKQFNIPKQLVFLAYKKVKANSGSAGVDKQTIEGFEKNFQGNLYKIWNRLSSGSYFSSPVKMVAIAKKGGGERCLGIPTINDRIAQMVIKLVFEPQVEPCFDNDSYGYRPNKSALDAIRLTRERCWWRSWVLEFDIKGLFDNIDHSLLMKAVKAHTTQKWILLYIERFIKAPIQMPDGSIQSRTKGVPQGGVISPVLSNLFLHYVFDRWMRRKYTNTQWCRYADDGLVHLRTRKDAEALKIALQYRFRECGLELHPEKTKIVYCNNSRYKLEYYKHKEFNFLGYTFRDRWVQNPETKVMFLGFNPGVSKSAIKSMRAKIRELNIRNRTDLSLEEIGQFTNPIIRGWIEYYGKFGKASLSPVLRHINLTLIAWAMQKYKKLSKHKTMAARFMRSIAERQPTLFEHWKCGMQGVFA